MLFPAKRRRRDDGWIVKSTVMIVTMMFVIHGSSADFSTLLRLAARTEKDRPERAALEPPTVTSLRPSDRGKSSGNVRVTVQSEQSGSHIPPVVASRSPSRSSNAKDFNSRYSHTNPRMYKPLAPMATASSSSTSRNIGGTTGRRSPENNHQTVLPPVPHLVNGTSVSMPQESSWDPPVSYGSSGYAPTLRGYSRHPVIQEENVVPEPSYRHNRPMGKNPYTEGIWGEARQQPSSSQGSHRTHTHMTMIDTPRTDTFGHSISEDLSHLSREHSPRHHSGRGQIHHPRQSTDVRYPSVEHHPQARRYPHNTQTRHHQNKNHQSGTHADSFGGQRTFSSHPERRGQTESLYRSHGLAPALHGSNFNGDQVHESPAHPREHFVRGESKQIYDQDRFTFSEGDSGPLTIFEVWQMKNMSNLEELVNFLDRKGLALSQIISDMDEGATKEELLEILNKPDSATVPQPSSPEVPYDKPEFSHKPDFEDYEEEFLLHPSTPTDEIDLDNIPAKQTVGNTSKGKKGNKRKGRNKKRGRKNRERNKRKRGKKDKKQTEPNLISTTDAFPLDISKNESLHQPTPSPTNLTDLSMVEEVAPIKVTEQAFPSGSSPSLYPTELSAATNLSLDATLFTDASTHSESSTPNYTAKHTQSFKAQATLAQEETTASLNSTSSELASSTLPPTLTWPQSVTLPQTTPLPIAITTRMTPVSDVISPPSAIPSVLSESEQVVTPFSFPRVTEPRTGSMTLPPVNKSSEVSIISFTVMEVPVRDGQDETFPENAAPVIRRQNHHKSHKKSHRSHPKRTYNAPKHHSPKKTDNPPKHLSPKKMDDEMVVRIPYVHEERKDTYAFPVKGFMIITGIMGAIAVFTLVVLICYAIIKCSKHPVVNNYQVSEQKAVTQ